LIKTGSWAISSSGRVDGRRSGEGVATSGVSALYTVERQVAHRCYSELDAGKEREVECCGSMGTSQIRQCLVEKDMKAYLRISGLSRGKKSIFA
jgi:hypothetical protein